ncbi:MAG TPA: HNH endonuclease signature motif containing protein [Acidimicrobiales bacterium]
MFDSPSRVIDVGVRQRYFTGATRRAVEVRDRQCSHPSCTVPADHCDIDHLIPFEDGGETTQANGDAKCRYHHRWKHRRDQPAA